MTQDNNKIFVYVENKTRAVSLELLSAARNLAPKSVCAIYLSNEKIDNKSAKEIFSAGADKIYEVLDEKLAQYNTLYYSNALIQLIKDKEPNIVLLGATHIGRELAPRVSSALETGLTADCTKLEIIEVNGESRLAATRPTFGGSLMATILCKKNPQMATVRENVIKKSEKPYKANGLREIFNPDLTKLNSKIKFLEFIKDEGNNIDNLTGAKIILAGGLGLKTKENFEKLEKLAKLMGASVGASRKAVEQGLISKNHQIGQTGKTVTPKIYVAFGISGAIHHLVGIENAEHIIAINNDKEAAIFKNCDFGIVDDAVNVIDTLISTLEETNKAQ